MTPVLLLAAAGLAQRGAANLPVPLSPLDKAPREFEFAARHRSDTATARAAFREAAAAYDFLWQHPVPPGTPAVDRMLFHPNRVPRTSALALNRGHAHFLAGNLPQAIAAFHDGLAVAPYDAELQHSLAAARATINYPDPPDPAERVRPGPVAGLRNRVAPWDLYRFAVVFAALVVVGLAKRLTTRPGWAGPVAAAGGLGLLVAAALGWAMHREMLADEAKPVAVVAADGVMLRRGNGESFPPRTAAKLPRGAEVRLLGRRGGWAQVELPGGAVGWLPEAAILVGDR